MNNAFVYSLCSAGETMQNIWEAASSKVAVFVYVAILAVILIAVILVAMRNENKDPKIVTTNAQFRMPSGSPAAYPTVTVKAEKGKGQTDEEGRSRFYMLCEIDANRARYSKASYDDSITLKRFCEEFRNFACSKLKLFYSIDDIRRFIAGLAVTKIVILQGMSGTGKTSLAYAFGEFMENSSTVVPVQPMWKERTDLVGYYNEFTKRFNETTLLQKMYEANYSKDIYITILDEMNIARVEYYFAEFLSLLELPNPDRRFLDVVSD